MKMNKILEEILKDKELNALVSTLTKEEIEDNLLVLYKQKQDNDYMKKNKGLRLDNDPLYQETYLEKRGSKLVQVFRESKKQELYINDLYMPNMKIDKELYLNNNRVEIFNAMKEVKKSDKGIYLYGSFGSGKTYLMIRLMKELAKEKDVLCVYYPEFINNVKAEIAKGNSIDEMIDQLKKASILFIDDIGREQNTIFNRDQILSVIINYRYQYNLQTFMTSNRSINELDDHLAETNDSIDRVASFAIIDRIRHMMKEIKLSGDDFRK